MSQELVPFDAKLPAHLKALADTVNADDLISGAGGGFPVISIKGKVFHEVRGGERRLITRADSEEPAASIEVVILRANPALSKTYYSEGYTDGSEEKPTCYSNDGVAPALDAAEPQAQKCATCPHNQWGSKITENGAKGKACADFRRMAVAPLGQLNDPMLIRVPAASLKALKEYGDTLKKRGVKYPMVVTKVGFDYSVAHPQLKFSPVSFLSEAQVNTVAEVIASDVVMQIIGMQNAAPQVPATATSGSEGAKPAVSAPAAAAPKMEASVVNTKPVTAKKEAAPAPKPAATPKPAPAKVVDVQTGDLEAELDKVLSAAGFDDK